MIAPLLGALRVDSDGSIGLINGNSAKVTRFSGYFLPFRNGASKLEDDVG